MPRINKVKFKSDGCTAFPDDLIDHVCCCFHDWDYWNASNWRDRLMADQNLFYCILASRKPMEKVWALPVFLAVRFAGWTLFYPRIWMQKLKR